MASRSRRRPRQWRTRRARGSSAPLQGAPWPARRTPSSAGSRLPEQHDLVAIDLVGQLPEKVDAVSGQAAVRADQRAALDRGLSHEQAVERIAVVPWQALDR